MKTGRWFFVLSVLLLAALLCVPGPAACAEEPAIGMDLSRIAAHADEIKDMREEVLIGYLNCVFEADETDDAAEQARLLDEADLLWTLYADLLSVQNKAESAAASGAPAAPQEKKPAWGNQNNRPKKPAHEGAFRPGEMFRPGENCVGCPFQGGYGPWHRPAWTPGWSGWDDDSDNGFFAGYDEYADYNDYDDYVDFWGIWSGEEFAVPGENELPAPEEPVLDERTDVPDEAGAPDETQNSADVYMDWSEFEQMFMQALMEALLGEEQTEQPLAALPNPWTETDSLDTAAAVSGLRLAPPAAEALPEGMELQRYRAMDGTVEADYSDGYDELMIRASLRQTGLALTGDYNLYSVEWQERFGDLSVDCLGNGERINAAAWSIGDVSYAVDMAAGKEGVGLTVEELGALVAELTAVPAEDGETAKTDIFADIKEPAPEPADTSDIYAAVGEPPAGEAESPEVPETAEKTESGTKPSRACKLIVGGGETFLGFD